MQVSQRIRSGMGYTDICTCPEFRGTTSGLGIIWQCSRLSCFTAEECTVTVTDRAHDGQVKVLPASLFVATGPFIGRWLSKMPLTATVKGSYEGQAVAITAAMGARKIQIFYPPALLNKMSSLEAELSAAIDAHFTVLQLESRTDMGAVYTDKYKCSLFTNQDSGLYIHSLCIDSPDSSIRWHTHFPLSETGEAAGEGCAPYTERLFRAPEENIARFSNIPLAYSELMLMWHRRELSIYCDYRDNGIYICWDKWLNNEYPDYIRWLNSALYEAACGHSYKFFSKQNSPDGRRKVHE